MNVWAWELICQSNWVRSYVQSIHASDELTYISMQSMINACHFGAQTLNRSYGILVY